MFDYLNQYAGALTVIFTLVVAVSTVFYAVLTARLVTETKYLRQAQTEPKVEVTVKPREEWINIIHLFVRNIGLGPAYNISFDVAIESGEEGAKVLIEDFTRANFLKAGLRYLGPGQEIMSDDSSMIDHFDQKIEAVISVKVKFENAIGKCYEEQYRLDFTEFKGRSQLGEPHLFAIANHLEKMQKDFHELATGFRRIKADVYDSEDRENEKKAREAHRAQHTANIEKKNEQ